MSLQGAEYHPSNKSWQSSRQNNTIRILLTVDCVRSHDYERVSMGTQEIRYGPSTDIQVDAIG
jgi:hypothetical protein